MLYIMTFVRRWVSVCGETILCRWTLCLELSESPILTVQPVSLSSTVWNYIFQQAFWFYCFSPYFIDLCIFTPVQLIVGGSAPINLQTKLNWTFCAQLMTCTAKLCGTATTAGRIRVQTQPSHSRVRGHCRLISPVWYSTSHTYTFARLRVEIVDHHHHHHLLVTKGPTGHLQCYYTKT